MKRVGRSVLGAVTVGVTWGAMSIATAPAEAYDPSLFLVAGNFYGSDKHEVLQYRHGSDADYMIEFEKHPGFISATPYTLAVGSSYHPFAGDFDGDGYDEIYWNHVPTGNDYMWDMSGPTDQVSSVFVADGLFVVAVGDFTDDGAEDIVWHAPGTATDHIWEFDVGGTYTDHTVTVNASYWPVAGNFLSGGGDEIVWYAPGTATDYIWQFTTGTMSYTSTVLNPPVNGANYRPYALDTKDDGYDDIFWYAAGPDQEYLWDYTATGMTSSAQLQVGSEYEVVTGDLFLDGHDDILFQGASTSIRDWHQAPSGVEIEYWSFGASLSAVVPNSFRRSSPAPLVGVPSGPPE